MIEKAEGKHIAGVFIDAWKAPIADRCDEVEEAALQLFVGAEPHDIDNTGLATIIGSTPHHLGQLRIAGGLRAVLAPLAILA